jgi:hypothetical protein
MGHTITASRSAMTMRPALCLRFAVQRASASPIINLTEPDFRAAAFGSCVGGSSVAAADGARLTGPPWDILQRSRGTAETLLNAPRSRLRRRLRVHRK